MLGVRDNFSPVSGVFAEEIRNAAWRMSTGNFTQAELDEMSRLSKVAMTNDIEWDD